MLDTRSLDPKELRNAFGCFTTGVTIVTMRDDQGRPTGVTINSFSSLSLCPPLCLFSVGNSQVSRQWLKKGAYFTVNVLAKGQDTLAWQFAAPRENKFDGVPTLDGRLADVPCIDGAIARFECRHWNSYPGGDHEIIVGEVLHFETCEGDPMLFYKGALSELAG